jgi:hypothetical protein
MFRALIFAAAFLGLSAQALTEKVTVLKANAFFVQNSENSLYEALDLKRERYGFGNADFDTCAKAMVRVKDTLHFTCTMPLPEKARISKRHDQLTPVVMTVPYAGQDRRVYITVSDDATSVIYSTEFDVVGLDLEFNKFNDDFFNIYTKSAVNVISEAMKRSLMIEVLESHDKKLASTN